MLSLKSLANIGAGVEQSALNAIVSCFNEPENPTEVRVAALHALR